jgi:cobalt-precorrin 5A hydrolase/precorrin-3B C17-methyltransferase
MIGLVSVTKAGRAAAGRLHQAWPGTRRYDDPAAAALPRAFAECDGIVCFLAVGATVRLIAPLLTGKTRDPGVVCVDEALRFAVPVLGAHQGGGNELATWPPSAPPSCPATASPSPQTRSGRCPRFPPT